jgi:hypothetical protein
MEKNLEWILMIDSLIRFYPGRSISNGRFISAVTLPQIFTVVEASNTNQTALRLPSSLCKVSDPIFLQSPFLSLSLSFSSLLGFQHIGRLCLGKFHPSLHFSSHCVISGYPDLLLFFFFLKINSAGSAIEVSQLLKP